MNTSRRAFISTALATGVAVAASNTPLAGVADIRPVLDGGFEQFFNWCCTISLKVPITVFDHRCYRQVYDFLFVPDLYADPHKISFKTYDRENMVDRRRASLLFAIWQTNLVEGHHTVVSTSGSFFSDSLESDMWAIAYESEAPSDRSRYGMTRNSVVGPSDTHKDAVSEFGVWTLNNKNTRSSVTVVARPQAAKVFDVLPASIDTLVNTDVLRNEDMGCIGTLLKKVGADGNVFTNDIANPTETVPKI